MSEYLHKRREDLVDQLAEAAANVKDFIDQIETAFDELERAVDAHNDLQWELKELCDEVIAELEDGSPEYEAWRDFYDSDFELQTPSLADVPDDLELAEQLAALSLPAAAELEPA